MIVGASVRRLSAGLWARLSNTADDGADEQYRTVGRHSLVGKGGSVEAERKPTGAVIPLGPTWSQFTRLPNWSSRWQQSFPFSAPTGTWAFSGRVALYHGVATLNLPAQSTILVPAYHQGVEIDALLAAGYALRYYRVDEHLRIDLADVEQRLDDTVSALYVTHYFGFPQPLEPIRRLCESRRLKLIEDCALSLFSRDDRTWLGSVGDLAIFSVYKTLPLPHGGFVVTKSERPTRALPPAPRASTFVQMGDLLQQGLRTSGWGQFEAWALRTSQQFTKAIRWNRRQTICSGSDWDPRMLGYGVSPWVARLMRLMDPAVVVARRRMNYMRLASRLRSHVTCPFPDLPAGTCPLFFPVIVPERRLFQQDLELLGVQSGNWWEVSHPTCPPELTHEMAAWRHDCLELPIHQELSAAHIDRIAAAVLTVLARRAHGDDRRPVASEAV